MKRNFFYLNKHFAWFPVQANVSHIFPPWKKRATVRDRDNNAFIFALFSMMFLGKERWMVSRHTMEFTKPSKKKRYHHIYEFNFFFLLHLFFGTIDARWLLSGALIVCLLSAIIPWKLFPIAWHKWTESPNVTVYVLVSFFFLPACCNFAECFSITREFRVEMIFCITKSVYFWFWEWTNGANKHNM